MTSKRVAIIPALIALLLIMLIADVRAAGESVAVIVNKENPVQKLTETELRRIYTNGMLVWPNGAPITMYDLAIQNPLRETFSNGVLGKAADRVAEEWAHLKITNQAKNPPFAIKSEALIIKRVANEKGAIGYVSVNSLRSSHEGVKVVATLQ